jgi:succinate dehydrogenase / fumarate reductase cytochrome b subunit
MLQMTSALSIMHRITGSAWSVGTVLLVWWLVAAATGEESFAARSGSWAASSACWPCSG